MSSRQPPRIGIFLPDLNFGGVERVTFQLAAGLASRGYLVDLVAGTARGTAVESIPPTTRLVDLRARRTFLALLPLVRYLRRERPEVLLAAKDHANVTAVLAAQLAHTGVPVVATVHSRPSDALRRPERWTGRVVRWLMPRCYARAAAVVGVSEGVADDLRALCAHTSADIRVIANPVISDAMVTAGEQPADHPWLDPSRAEPVVVWCGRLSEEKDPLSALQGLALLRARTDARLLLVGDGPLRSRVEERVRELDLERSVAITGYVLEPAPFLRHCDVFLLSSRREGLPTALIEALALGARVVATDCHSGPREILLDGKLGQLVPVGDAVAIANALELALASPAAAVPTGALARYTVATATDRYVDLLKEVSST